MKLKTISVQKQGEKTETSETTILEYKEVEGIKFPARIKTSAGGQNMEVVINEVTLNAKLKKKDLIK